MTRGWMLAGLRRDPGPVIGSLVASATAAALTVAAIAVGASHSPAPPGRLAGAAVVVAGDTTLRVTTGQGDNADTQDTPLPAYRGVPVSLAGELARVPGVASATPESGFPDGTTRPGIADLIAIKAGPGVSAATLSRRVTRALDRAPRDGGAGYTVATGAARGELANPGLAIERANGQGLGAAVIPLLLLAALFALAATTALSVSLRRRRFALLRAVGATRGQVRRAVLTEQALIAIAGGIGGYLPGAVLGGLGAGALVAHGMLPPGSTAPASPWLILAAAGINLPVCVLSALAAARRAARTSPAQAMAESWTDRRRLDPFRIILGLVVGGGMVALDVVSLHQSGPGAQAAMAAPLLLAGMAAFALLGPLAVAAAAAVARPLRGTGPPARLALAAISALPRRTASAVIPVAMAVAMIGAVAFSNTSIARAATTQSAASVRAGAVLGGDGLTGAVLGAAGRLPGTGGTAAISPVSLGVQDPSLWYLGGAALAGTRMDRALDLGVVSGQLSSLRPGQIAVSAIEASSGTLGVRLGSAVTVYLPDGTPYRARVSAIFRRSLALGDVLIPASVAAGHTGSPARYSQILVAGARPGALRALAAAHPGVTVTSPRVHSAQVQQAYAQDSFGDLLILIVIAILAAVTLVNTLAVATFERRRSVRLLRRAGATRGQLAGMFGWQALFVTVTGIGAGAVVCAAALIAITRSVTGTITPSIPVAGAALVVGSVAVLAGGTILASMRAVI